MDDTIRLTTEACLLADKESRGGGNARKLGELLDELTRKTFDGWTVEDGEPAHYIFGHGCGDKCRPEKAILLHGSDLPMVLRQFAEIVVGCAMPSCYEDDGPVGLDVEISNEMYAGGLHIVVTEQVEYDDEEAPCRYTLDQLPSWNRLHGKGVDENEEGDED